MLKGTGGSGGSSVGLKSTVSGWGNRSPIIRPWRTLIAPASSLASVSARSLVMRQSTVHWTSRQTLVDQYWYSVSSGSTCQPTQLQAWPDPVPTQLQWTGHFNPEPSNVQRYNICRSSLLDTSAVMWEPNHITPTSKYTRTHKNIKKQSETRQTMNNIQIQNEIINNTGDQNLWVIGILLYGRPGLGMFGELRV